MTLTLTLEYFLSMYYQPFLIIIGLCGNILSFLVFNRKNFDKLATRSILMLIAVIDTFCLLQIIDHFFRYCFGYYLRRESDFTCKLFTYLIYSFGPISAWLIVFTSIERFFSISMPTSTIGLIFKRKSFQIKICLFIFVFNMIYYTPFLIFVENKCVNKSFLNDTSFDLKYCCDFRDTEIQQILSLADGFNSAVIPFFLMLLSSILIIVSIFKSRFRLAKMQNNINNNNNNRSQQHKLNRKRLKRDIQFGLISIYMNVLFIAFNLPVCVTLFYNDNITDLIYLIMVDVYYSSYAINFFIYLLFNSLFRNEFFNMLKNK